MKKKLPEQPRRKRTTPSAAVYLDDETSDRFSSISDTDLTRF